MVPYIGRQDSSQKPLVIFLSKLKNSFTKEKKKKPSGQESCKSQ